MKTLLTLAIICLSASTLFAKKGPDNNIQKPNYYVSKDTIYLVTNDTLKLSISQKYDSCSTPDWHRDMPWIGAVLLGIMTIIANLIISRQTRISNREVTEKQIDNTKDIAITQIENAQKNAQMEFNKTVLSGNRQAWINELREVISKILSKIVVMSVKKNFTTVQYEELKFLITKTELMLNDSKDKEFIKVLNELEGCVLTPQIAGHNLINKLGQIKFGNYDKNTTKFYT